ncbi:MAG: hypothetical protein R6V19_07250 [Armatimonadota bacterium]
MIVILASDMSPEWLQNISRHLGDRAMMLEAQTPPESVEMARSLPLSIYITDMQNLTRQSLQTYEQILQAAPGVVTICIAAADVINQARTEDLLRPNFWIDPGASDADITHTLQEALQRAELAAPREMLTEGAFHQNGGCNGSAPPDSRAANSGQGADDIGMQSNLLHRMLSGPGGSFDTTTLFNSYLQAVTEYVRCASYCLLRRDESILKQGKSR